MAFTGRLIAGLLLIGSLAFPPFVGQAQETGAALVSLLEQAQTAQSSGDYAGAATLYARATGLSPQTAELWSNRGVMEVLAGKKDAAIPSLKHALQLNPNLLPPMLFLGRVYVEMGKPASAIQYLRRAGSLRPNDAEVQLTLGKAYMSLEEPQAALMAYSSAARVAPGDVDAWFGLGVSSLHIIEADGSSLATAQPRSIWSRALLADDLYAQGRPLEATETYRAEMEKASPTEKNTLLQTLGWMLSHADALALPQNSVEAMQTLKTQLQPTKDMFAAPGCAERATVPRAAMSASGATREAACAFWSGDAQSSATLASAALQHSPGDPEALYWSIKANERIAVDALSQFEALSAHSAANFVLVGNLFRMQRQPDRALGEYQKALALDSHDPAALRGEVLACIDADRLEQAVSFDMIALADRPLDPELNLMMAEVLDTKNQQNQQEAAVLSRALTVPPELQPRLHYLLARVAARDGRTQEAIQQYLLALPGDKDGSMHYQLSRLYRQTGDLAEAQRVLTEAKALIHQHDANAAVAVREATAINP